jgi:hypothetical protein
MKYIILAIAIFATTAQAQTIRCVKHIDGSMTCRTVKGF